MLLGELVEASARVGATRGRLEKVERLTACLRGAPADEVELAVSWLSGVVPGGALGIGPALVFAAKPEGAAARATLGVREVQDELRALARESGPGSRARREERLGRLLARATRDEQGFLIRLLTGELRQGALEGAMVEAVARAAELPAADVRRAWMLSGALPAVARTAFAEGGLGLARFRVELFRPLQPMLARTAEDVPGALEKLGRAALEHKLDGARVQVHKAGDEVRVYTRRLNDVTAAVPEVVETCRALPARELVLDGEAIALRPDGTPHPFQVTMRRVGRRKDVAAARRSLPLSVAFFDALFVDGEELLDRPAAERFEVLDAALPGELVIPRLVTDAPDEGEAFLAAALRSGHEGVMAKDLAAGYAAGVRGGAWLKVKPAHTLDLVVLAAEWGSGRRRGWLSNLHLGARDPATGGFVMLGKTFKGLTDEMLAWQTERLQELELGRDGHVVQVRPELVVEIAVDELQESPHYPAGLALRFARVKRHRPDKRAADADTIDTVRGLRRGG